MLLPESAATPVIMVATGTGIAPMRRCGPSLFSGFPSFLFPPFWFLETVTPFLTTISPPPLLSRSYIRRFFVEEVEGYKFTGLAWLFMGVANSDAKLYDDEFQACLKRFPDQFRLDYALSREENNRKGGKMYIQDKARGWVDRMRTPFCLPCDALAGGC